MLAATKAIMELFAAFMSLYLTDRLVYHWLTLLGKQQASWKTLAPCQALALHGQRRVHRHLAALQSAWLYHLLKV